MHGCNAFRLAILVTGVACIENCCFAHLERYEKFNILQKIVEMTRCVKPSVPFPIFSFCGNISRICYSEVTKLPIQCQVSHVRPNVTLRLTARTVDGDKTIPNQAYLTLNGTRYTSRVTTRDAFQYSSLLALLVCEASSTPGMMLRDNESMLLAQNGTHNISLDETIYTYIERGSRMELNCTQDDIAFLVWRKIKDQRNDILVYSVFLGENFTNVAADEVLLGEHGSLIVPTTRIKHEGLYMCIFGNGLTNDVNMYDVVVEVYPKSRHPVIEECNDQEYCQLEAEHEGSLTCTVHGIRPLVQLEWRACLDNDASTISFRNQHLKITENKETFDVSLTSTYHVTDRTRDRITIECKSTGTTKVSFDLTTKMDLVFKKEQANLSTIRSLLLAIIIAIVVFLSSLTALAVIYKCRHTNDADRSVGNIPEMTSMLRTADPVEEKLSGIKSQFLKELKEKYRNLYDAVQPIPYIKDRLYCVDKIFVESGIELMVSHGNEVWDKEKWKRITSYRDVVGKFSRHILEGDPGYGKSTVTLQLAYDWCNSALDDVDILILLRLRQLGGVESIYRAIKQFLLPLDSILNECDIRDIILKSQSVVLILDGFDEYPDANTKTDIINIVAKNMLQESQVVLTTRSSFLPKVYPPSTARLRLTGFDVNARRYYIRKAVVGDDEEKVQNIEMYIQQNPILSDLCQVPLFFVIFAHMTFESDQFRKICSVTSFFRYMISSFHSHMKNKMEASDVATYETFVIDHRKLDKLAFDALSRDSGKIVWQKEQIRQQIGEKFYEQYVRTGILVEEEVIDICDDPGTIATQHVMYKTEVRFYHKLFCEWYAAHYLSDFTEENPKTDINEFLQHLDPSDVQYTYRFACGLNPSCTKKIIDYLKEMDGCEKFAILCILEQTGRFDQIRHTVSEICSEGVVISGHDSLLLQRSSMQLIDLAARNGIQIEKLFLHDCLQSVDLSATAIRIHANLPLTSKVPVKWLSIHFYNREISTDEAIAILKFSSMCPSLNHLRYFGCVPPRSFETGSFLSTLKSRNVKVSWRWRGNQPRYILNFDSGRWEEENNGSEPSAEDFDKMLAMDAEERKGWTEANYKRWVQKAREKLRHLQE